MHKLIEFLYLHQKNNLVYYDSLTGVKSRMYYDRVLKPKYQKKEVMIVFIDVNSLKKINDTKGHYEGSKMIKRVANQLKEISDIYEICRIGGDEFIVVCDPYKQVSDFDSIEGVTYGFYIKEELEDVSSAVSKADKLMYKYKQKIHE